MGGGTYEETLFCLYGLHGSAVGFLYGLLFCSGWSLDSIILADHAVKFRQRHRKFRRDQDL